MTETSAPWWARNPFRPATYLQRETLRAMGDASRAAAVLGDRVEDVLEVGVGETPGEVVYRENKLRLIHYESLTDEQCDVPILVVYALINRPFVLDLQPNRSVVRRLLEAGHDVYLIDWGEPSRLDSSLGLYDYVERYLDNCVDVVGERSGSDAVNLLGYCMGGTFSAMYAALHPEKVNALGLLAAGLYFEDSGGVLELWGDEEYYDPEVLAERFGTVPWEFLAVGFATMDPVENYVTKYVRLADNLENEDFVENFARMEWWLDDGVDLAGDAYAEFVEELYQENRLYRNELEVGGRRVDVTRIDAPVLQIVGEYDTLVPNEASLRFNDVVGSDDVTTVEYPTGHVGLSVSTSAHRDLWPEVAEWYLEHSGLPSYADAIAEGVEEVLGVDVETDVTVGDLREVQVGVADENSVIVREVVERSPEAILAFLEASLGVDITLDVGVDCCVIAVDDGEEVHRVEVEGVGETIRGEIEESVEDLDYAAPVDLQSVEGIGPTYAGRLRDAGVETVRELATADAARVAEAADASETQARRWIRGARQLIE